MLILSGLERYPTNRYYSLPSLSHSLSLCGICLYALRIYQCIACIHMYMHTLHMGWCPPHQKPTNVNSAVFPIRPNWIWSFVFHLPPAIVSTLDVRLGNEMGRRLASARFITHTVAKPTPSVRIFEAHIMMAVDLCPPLSVCGIHLHSK